MSVIFLIDEDLPRSTAKLLRSVGYDALDVRDIGLRGAKDSEIFAYASKVNATIATADVGFASMIYLSSQAHTGIILLRLPIDIPITKLNEILLKAIASLSDEDLDRHIIVVDQQKIRIRRSKV
jgi:predicted nuclease of predicted toxin-antitoxin system